MFYKQPWSSISTDIINDKRPNSTRPKKFRIIIVLSVTHR
jgi:hypothetical protein